MEETDITDFGEDVQGESLEDIEQVEPRSKLKKEIAEAEFKQWTEYFRINTDVDSMDLEDKKEFNTIKDKFVYHLQKGFTSITEEGNLQLHLEDKVGEKDKFVFRRKFKGSAFVIMDRYKENQTIHKSIAFLAAWIGWDPKNIMKCDAKDVWFGIKMVGLFFGA